MAINWISAQNNDAYITLDSQRRIYISSGARNIIGLPNNKSPFYLTLGYDEESRRLVCAKPENVKADVAPFKFDKRSYNKSASKVLKTAGFREEDLPLRFYMVGEGEAAKQAYMAYPEGIYAFELSRN
ncbi:hypothetical protein NRS6185_03781 [Bacillus subtilis]|uniref:hypothetical protein n=1 Tax=Bacillus subtilis TaxID=1423 RepID=UPI001B9C98F3|nr:hypothetical protein [Bacillus subtilis]CAF1897257.1 hypothetical protein NRS6185_03781 [Bacillus subtilis]